MTAHDHDQFPGPADIRSRQRARAVDAAVRLTATASGLVLALLIFGFAVFSATVMRETSVADDNADGIIVLTGGDFRIPEGGRLLQAGRATRMLISGVNATTSRDDLIRLSGLDVGRFDCCVDLGYAAQDTVGNAEEARMWARSHELRRLIIVTSNYHMPRSLAEIELALPKSELIPYPVIPRTFRTKTWWLHFGAARLLLSEYVKFLPVAAKVAAMRYLAPWLHPTLTAERPAPRQS